MRVQRRRRLKWECGEGRERQGRGIGRTQALACSAEGHARPGARVRRTGSDGGDLVRAGVEVAGLRERQEGLEELFLKLVDDGKLRDTGDAT